MLGVLCRCASRQLAVPSVVQAHAWAALGKVCLCNEALTNSTAPLLVQVCARLPHPEHTDHTPPAPPSPSVCCPAPAVLDEVAGLAACAVG